MQTIRRTTLLTTTSLLTLFAAVALTPVARTTDVKLPTTSAVAAKPPPQNGFARLHHCPALLHGPEQIADLPVPVGESPGAVSIGHAERGHLVEYLAPNSVFNSLPRQRSSPHLGPHDRLVTIDRVLHHASLGAA